MIGTITKVEVQNLIYVAGALVLIVILSIFVTLRHRKPKSVESNMESFNRGLQALAPDADPVRRRPRSSPARPSPPPASSLPRRTVTIRPAESPMPAGDDIRPGATGGSPSGEGRAERVNPTSLEAETG
jgi:hypothetical protein